MKKQTQQSTNKDSQTQGSNGVVENSPKLSDKKTGVNEGAYPTSGTKSISAYTLWLYSILLEVILFVAASKGVSWIYEAIGYPDLGFKNFCSCTIQGFDAILGNLSCIAVIGLGVLFGVRTYNRVIGTKVLKGVKNYIGVFGEISGINVIKALVYFVLALFAGNLPIR